jgi:hypothetical protein
MKKIIIAISLLALSTVTTQAQSKKKVISSVVLTFTTTNNDKDHDTYLYVALNTHDYRFNADYYLAKKDAIGGHWNNGSVNTVTLDMAGRHDLEQISNASIRLVISPNGSDKWEFNYKVDIIYLDEQGVTRTLTKDFGGKVMADDTPVREDVLF